MRSLLAGISGLELVTPAALGLHLEVEENGEDYAANAALKAQAFCQASGLPCLADDSGLEVQALGGEPGLHSARTAPTAAERRTMLLQRLAAERPPWKARFRSTLCLALPDGKQYFAEGDCLGEISPVERGDGGFGYDPLFIVEGQGRSMAELSMQEKNRLSHRARAVENIKGILAQVL